MGIVQGLTEFLPVSSSGHLILFQKIFNLQGDMLLFDIILHIATLCAVVIVFRKRIWQLILHPFNKTNYCLIVATVLTCALVVLFKDFIDGIFNYKILPVTFILTAILLYMTSFLGTAEPNRQCPVTHHGSQNSAAVSGAESSVGMSCTTIKKKAAVCGSTAAKKLPVGDLVSYKSSVIAGLAQGIAVIPGLSRSGTTISVLLFAGTEREKAAEFSFLMSIPVIIASFLFELLTVKETLTLEILPTCAAFLFAFASGVIAIKFMLRLVKCVGLQWFSLYLVILSLVCLYVL